MMGICNCTELWYFGRKKKGTAKPGRAGVILFPVLLLALSVGGNFKTSQSMKISQYLGIVLGASYGLLIRLLGGLEAFSGFYNIYSITFIWITPFVISLIPFLIPSNELYKSKARSFFFPVLAVLLFGLISLSTRL